MCGWYEGLCYGREMLAQLNIKKGASERSLTSVNFPFSVLSFRFACFQTMNLGDQFVSCLKTICSVLMVCYGILFSRICYGILDSLSPDTFQGVEEFICRLVGSLVQVWVRNLGAFYHEMHGQARRFHSLRNFFLGNMTLFDHVLNIDVLPPFQIIRHSNNFGESKNFMFDQIYIIE